MAKFFAPAALSLSLLLSGCDAIGVGSKEPYEHEMVELENYKFDSSNPEALLKSFWSFTDKVNAVSCGNIRSIKMHNTIIENMEPVYTGTSAEIRRASAYKDYDDCKSSQSIYDRKITKIDQQSDTRVVVTYDVKNVSPIPAGASHEDFMVEARDKGETYRVDFVKIKETWAVEQTYTLGYNGEWRPHYTKEDLLPQYPAFVTGHKYP